MKLSTPHRERKEENLVPLINIVFLILIFFLVASTIRPFTDRQVKLAETIEASKSSVVPRMVVVRADGARLVNNQPIDEQALQAQLAAWANDNGGATVKTITVVADKTVAASQLIDVVTMANAAGIADVKLLTRKAR